jgi:hypothetical protein
MENKRFKIGLGLRKEISYFKQANDLIKINDPGDNNLQITMDKIILFSTQGVAERK